jgi:hypothetical protein
MGEFLARVYELTISGEQAVSISAWCLTFVTALDAKVGVRIYTRMNILIHLITVKVSSTQPEPEPEAIETDPLITYHAVKTLNTARDRYIRA